MRSVILSSALGLLMFPSLEASGEQAAVSVQTGHAGAIRQEKFTSDGQFLVTGGDDGTARIWDPGSGLEITGFLMGSQRSFIALSTDGKRLATFASVESRAPGTIIVFNLETMTEIARTIDANNRYPAGVQFLDQDRRIVTHGDNTNTLWDSSTLANLGPAPATLPLVWEKVETIGIKSRKVTSKDGTKMAGVSGSRPEFIDPKSGKPLHRPILETPEIQDLVVSAKHQVFGAHFDDDDPNVGAVRMWSLSSLRPVTTLEQTDVRRVLAKAFTLSEDGDFITTLKDDGFETRALATGKVVQRVKGARFELPPTSDRKFVFNDDDSLHMVKGASSSKMAFLERGCRRPLWRGFSPDSSKVAVLCSTSKNDQIQVYDLRTQKLLVDSENQPDFAGEVAFSPDGETLRVGSGLYDPRTLQKRATLPGGWKGVFTPDSKTIAITNRGNKIFIADVATGELKQTLEGHTTYLHSIQLTEDGKVLISGANDDSIVLWDFATGKILARMAIFGLGKEYVIYTPDHYYLASKGAMKGIAFRVGQKLFPFSQFDLRYHRPDIVMKRIGYADQKLIDTYERAYHRRLKHLGFTEEMLADDFHVPTVHVSTEKLAKSTEATTYAFELAASDGKYALDRVNVYVNDVPIYGRAGLSLRGKNLRTYSHIVNLELTPGTNQIAVTALNEKGVESQAATFDVNCEVPPSKPNLWMVALGVSKYRDAAFDLTYAAKDAKDLAQTLQGAREAYAEKHILRLIDADVSRDSVTKAVAELEKAKVGDQVVVFYAGHGLLDDQLDYYLATSDVDFEHPSEHGLPYDLLETALDKSPARRKLLLLDACHSGEVDKDDVQQVAAAGTAVSFVKSRGLKRLVSKSEGVGLSGSFELMREVFSDLRRGSGAVVISSASGTQYAFESPKWKNGVFTYALLEGLKSGRADRDSDRSVSVSELRDHVATEVERLTNGQQTPTARRENLLVDFRVY